MSAVEVTVLMPVFNAAGFLRPAIESILSQTFHDFEFLIINDGSTDNSEEIINSFKDDRISYLANVQNEGLIFCLNKGISLARGKFIARMDADDISLPQRLELQLNLFHANKNLVVAGSDYIEFDQRSSSLIRNNSDSDYQKATLLFATCFAHPTVMMKNIFAEGNILYKKEYIHTEDYKLWTDISFLGDFGNVPAPLLKYRRHTAQITSKHRETQYQKSALIRREYCAKLGFNLSGNQFDILNKLGNNVFVTEKKLLDEILDLLSFLIAENKRLRVFNEHSFMMCVHRFWFDICGHTNLGLFAYNTYVKSDIAQAVQISFSEKTKLAAKCLLRKFRS